MTPRIVPVVVASVAAVLSSAHVWYGPMPLPFSGFSAVAAAVLAALGTLTAMAWLPSHWLWSETERLTLAFRAQHQLSATAAAAALETISGAHNRAQAFRKAAFVMRDDMADEVKDLADQLDATAREIFYHPGRRRDVRSILMRSELVEEAAIAHAALRRRKHRATEDISREKLSKAVQALKAAFDQADLLAARGLLQEVEVASEVAEQLLTPRNRSVK